MKKTKVIPLRIPENLYEIAALKADQEHMDKATALRQWLHDGAEKYVMQALADGWISRGRAVELLDVTYYDIYPLLDKYGLDVGPSDEQIRLSHENAKNLKLAAKAKAG